MTNFTDNLIFNGHPDYFQPENITQDMQNIFVLECGKYKAKYNFYDIPFGYFPEEHRKKWNRIMGGDNPMYSWEISTKLEILDENNNVIITKHTNYTPCINLYGDGFDLEKTYYTIFETENDKPVFNIYNISNTYKKSLKVCWYSLNLDIKITLFDNKYYVIIYEDKILAIAELEKIINDENKYISAKEHNIVPLCGQNRMFCVKIKNNMIIFNNCETCPINNIKYDISKFLLQGNPIYNKNLYNNPKTENIKHFVHTCGIFSAEYDYQDHCGRFDSNIGKFGKSALVIFKENENIIFKMNSGSTPSIILYGDGKTREGTKFCIGSVSIYDFNQKLIRTTCIGADSHHDIQKVNDKYAISNSIEVCSWCNFFGIIDLELFFGQTGDEEPIRAYDNARIHVPLHGDDRIYATCADEEGFVLNNGHVLKYEDAEGYDFSSGEGYIQLDFSKLGYSEEQVKNINDMLLKGQTVSIPFSSEDKKIES